MENKQSFKSAEDAIDYISSPTAYEKEHKITVEKKILIHDGPTIKLLGIIKSDHTTTLVIVFKTSLQFESWLFWMPSDPQFSFLVHELPKIINITEIDNKIKRNGI